MTHWGANRNRWSSLTSCTGRFLHRLNWERRVCHARYCLKSACSATGRWNYVCTISWGAWGNISTQASSSVSAGSRRTTLKPLATKPYCCILILPAQFDSRASNMYLNLKKGRDILRNVAVISTIQNFTWRLKSFEVYFYLIFKFLVHIMNMINSIICRTNYCVWRNLVIISWKHDSSSLFQDRKTVHNFSKNSISQRCII